MSIISITGATGNMGCELVPALLKCNREHEIRLLLKPSKKNERFASVLQKKHKNIKVFFASIVDYDALLPFVDGASYCIHMAAIIPPRADYNDEDTYETNYIGTKNLVDAIVAKGGSTSCAFIHIGSVAQYGNRTPSHPFGRAGDPLMPSTFDVYAASKVRAERYVIESSLKYWVVLRQTGVLYDKILMKNMNDGLMFHTPLNCPIEWVTAKDSARLLSNLIASCEDGSLQKDEFYGKIYNIGGGAKMRCTGYETLDEGFRLMGSSVRKVFKPEWIAKRNFHCMWFLDSHVLEDLFHFQKTSFREFFASLAKKYWYFKLAKPFLALVKFFVVRPLLKNKNSPAFWQKKDRERYEVFCGISLDSNLANTSNSNNTKRKNEWDGLRLFCEGASEKENVTIDYESLKDEKIDVSNMLLFHGYDDSKKDCDIDINDVISAAKFRGGSLLSDNMVRGDMRSKLEWQCHKGHKFFASPALILRGGHWCPECTEAPPWRFGELAKDVPFYAQLYYSDHNKDECKVYKARPLNSLS